MNASGHARHGHALPQSFDRAVRAGRIALLAGTAAIACAPGAFAACTSTAPASDAVVTCTGSNTAGVIADASERVTLTVSAGGSIVPASGSSILLGIDADVTVEATATVGNDALGVGTRSILLGAGSELRVDGLVRGQNGVAGQTGGTPGGLSGSTVTVGAGGQIITAAAFSNSAGIDASGGGNTLDIHGIVRANGTGGDAIVLGGAGNLLTIRAGGLVEAMPSNTALGVDAADATGATIVIEDGGAIVTHGMGSAIDIGADANITVAGTISVLGDLAPVNSAGAYGIIADPSADIWVTGTGKILTGNAGNVGNGGNGAIGIYAFNNAPSDTTIRVDGVIETYKANAIFAGTGNSITIGETGRLTTRGTSRTIFVRGYTTPAEFTSTVNIDGRVESLGTGAALFLSGDRLSANDPRVNFVANVTIGETGSLFTQNGTVYSEDGGTSFFPDVIDNLTVAGRIERGTAGTAINLSSGADTITLLPTAVIIGNINGGSTATSQTEIDSFVLDGAAGTTGTYNFATAQLSNFEAGVKKGAGTWVLNGSLTAGGISGAFAVQQGTLQVDGALNSGGATVASGATLTGGGSVAGTTNVAAGGTLAGESGKTLTLAALNLADGASVDVALGAPSNTALFSVTGALTLDGELHVSDGGGFGEGTYRLFNYGGALTNNGLVIDEVPAGFNPGDWTLDAATAGQVDLIVALGEGAQYWDGADTSPGGVANGRGGNGTWNSASTNWTNQAGTINAPWASQIAVFSANGGAGTVTVDGQQTFSGLRFLLGSDYTFNAAGGGGSLLTNTAATVIDLGGAGDADAAINVTIAGTGGLRKLGGGTLTLGAANTYSGGTDIDAGTVVVTASNALGTGDVSVAGGSALHIAGSAAAGSVDIVNDGTVAFLASGTAAGADIVNNGIVAIDGLTAASTSVGSLSGAGDVLLGDRRLIVGALGQDDVIGGEISDDTGQQPDAGSLEKVGAGTLTLSGSNTYGGGTTVSGGRLLVNGAVEGNAQAASGGTLGGSGSIVGLVDVADGGTLLGVAGQKLTMGDLTLHGAANVNISLAAPIGTGLFDVAGDLTLDGVLNVTDAGGFGEGVYRLIDYGGALTDNGMTIGSVPVGYSPGGLIVQTSVASQVNLVVSAAPDIQFWNGTTISPTGRVEGGPGTWISDTTRNWTDANGTRSDAWADKFAVFQGGRDAASVAVTVDGSAGDIVTTGMQFIGTGWTLEGDPIVLNGANGATTIRVGDGSEAGAGDTATIGSVLTGATRLVKDDLGTLILTGANTYAGGTTIAHGTLQLGNGGTAGSVTGPIENNGVLIFNRSDALSLGGVISGGGAVRQVGPGTTTLSANSSAFAGSTTIEGGALSVDGALGGTIAVQAGGRLQGSGTVGATAVASGGTVAPGSSIGTLAVAGDASFAGGSSYEVEVNAGGDSDLLDVTGDVTINGGTVTVLAEDGDYAPYTQYTIITADGGVTGNGFAGATSNLAFLAPSLFYDANNVYLLMVRNDVDFSAVGQTPNQIATGAGVETLGGADPLYIAVVMLTEDEARSAFEDLSGEIHASARTALVEDSRFVREAALDRARAPFAADAPRFAVWGQGFGSWGHGSGDGNASRLSRSTGGFLVGADAVFGEAFRAGVTGGYSMSDFDVAARRSSGDSDNYHLGMYAGVTMGGFGLRLGGAYSWHSLETERAVAFRGLSDMPSAGYDAHTAQVFGELAWRFDLGGGSVEPFAGIAYVDLRTASFEEAGGAAALVGARDGTDATFSTLGLRGAARLSDAVSLRGMIGWRHAYGDVDGTATLAFVGGGPFTVGGVPIAKDVAVIEAGLEASLGPAVSLGVRYSGQIASGATDHGVKVDLVWRF